MTSAAPDLGRIVPQTPASGTQRLDAALVERGLARSRSRAQALIRSGAVRIEGQTITRVSQHVGAHEQVTLDTAAERWVGRGALKLLHALTEWPDLHPTGKTCLDVGASTGGFTQVLLEHGAAHVVALDVGHGQLVGELAGDPRVSDLPGRNIRYTTPEDLVSPSRPDGRFDLVVADLSFISLTLTLAPMAALTRPDGDLLVLVKPQFEVGRERLGHGGIVTSDSERDRALTLVTNHALSLGLHVRGVTESPIRGGAGNLEYLLWMRT